MLLLKCAYEKLYHKPAPYYYSYSLQTIIKKPIRKFVTNVITPICPFNNLRIVLYRLCGFTIGRDCFVGMQCYFDDMCYDQMRIGNNVVISYGVYFSCHGKGQEHLPITIQDGAYIGMCSRIISKTKEGNGVVIGQNAIVGACTLVNKNIPANTKAVGVPCRIIR